MNTARNTQRIQIATVAGCFALSLAACDTGGADGVEPDGTTPEGAEPEGNPEPTAEAYAETILAGQWAADMTLAFDGDTLTIADDGLPSHAILEAYALFNGTTTGVSETPYSMTFPMNPTVADAVTETNLGAIGVAISGGVFFNPYEGDGVSVALDDNFDVDGVPFIDACSGHPLGEGTQYHYHGVPYCITDDVDTAGEHSVMIGILLDGFPIFGPLGENGIVPSDLDECLGHDGPTPEFPEGIYHYHTSESAPYIVSCFKGEVEVQVGPGGPGDAMDCAQPGDTMCCGDGVCDGPETADSCAADC